MPDSNPHPAPTTRADGTRARVLHAAERLLREGRAEFSMRDLAAEAGVSFATPFNSFGSKAAIMHALSAQRIATMGERFDAADPAGDAAGRVLAAVTIAVGVMLAEPTVNRAVMATLGMPGGEGSQAYAGSRALWARALGAGDGLAPDLVATALVTLPDQLAVAFRGALSFWTAGEIGDAALLPRARLAVAALLLGFLAPGRRSEALGLLDGLPHS